MGPTTQRPIAAHRRISSDVKVTFQNDDTLHFQGVSGGTAYESVLQFYDTIDAEASTYKVLLDPFGSM